jgi:hypothetical protein
MESDAASEPPKAVSENEKIAVEVGKCKTAGRKKQPVPSHITETAAGGGQPVRARIRGQREGARATVVHDGTGAGAAAQVKGFDVAFQAEQQIAGLPVVAGLEAPVNPPGLMLCIPAALMAGTSAFISPAGTATVELVGSKLPHAPPAVPPI